MQPCLLHGAQLPVMAAHEAEQPPVPASLGVVLLPQLQEVLINAQHLRTGPARELRDALLHKRLIPALYHRITSRRCRWSARSVASPSLMSTAIGRYRHRIEIQRSTWSQDPVTGEMTYSWETEAIVWAAVEPLQGREFFAAASIQSETTKGERGHELAMQDKALEFEKLRGAQRMSEIGAGADAAWNVGAIETLREAVRTQGEKTGVRWADALSISVRPVITYWFMALYCATNTATVAAAVTGGTGSGVAILYAWAEADQALWAGVLNFWFLGRVFDRVRP